MRLTQDIVAPKQAFNWLNPRHPHIQIISKNNCQLLVWNCPAALPHKLGEVHQFTELKTPVCICVGAGIIRP